MFKNEIIVNNFRYPEKEIKISREKEENLNNTLIIRSNDNETEENLENNNYYFLTYLPNNNASNIENLILKNINIDLSKSTIYFQSLKLLYLIKSN